MTTHKLYGAILGDLVGQPYEFPAGKGPYVNVQLHNPKSMFTDDTVMTLAVAKYLVKGEHEMDQYFKDLGKQYPDVGYGAKFKEWIHSAPGTVGNSWGNGCLMRLSPVMYLSEEDQEDIQYKFEQVVNSVMGSHASTRSVISVLKLLALYDEGSVGGPIQEPGTIIEPFKVFDSSAASTIEVVEKLWVKYGRTHDAIIAAVELGGDTDTNASVIGELMNFTYNDLTDEDVKYVESKLTFDLLEILIDFNTKFS